METQGDFHHFWDFIETFYLFREKISSDSQEEKDVVGEFKVRNSCLYAFKKNYLTKFSMVYFN